MRLPQIYQTFGDRLYSTKFSRRLQPTTTTVTTKPIHHCLTIRQFRGMSASIHPHTSLIPSNINHLAVYGTLRDDDDSNASWTKEFIEGHVQPVSDGEVMGAEMFWDLSVGYPKVILDAPTNQTTYERDQSKEAIQPPSPPPSSIRVRLLSWSPRTAFDLKLAAADVIEGYSPLNESGSEYVRRAIWVKRYQQPEHTSFDYVPAWIYVMVEGTKAVPGWKSLQPHGDWMKRDRSLINHDQRTTEAQPK